MTEPAETTVRLEGGVYTLRTKRHGYRIQVTAYQDEQERGVAHLLNEGQYLSVDFDGHAEPRLWAALAAALTAQCFRALTGPQDAPRPGVSFTRQQVQAWAGCDLTDTEITQLEEALELSTLPEIVATVATHLPDAEHTITH